MAEQHRSGNNTVSPLFNKMDNLMARHRGGGNNIPVLNDALPSDGFGLMFDPEELKHKPGPVLPPPVAAASYPPMPTDEPPTFLDLPMLDLDYLVPDEDAGHIAEAEFDLEIDEPHPATTPAIQPQPVQTAVPASSVQGTGPNAAANAVAAKLAEMSAAIQPRPAPVAAPAPQQTPPRPAPATIAQAILTLEEVVPQFPNTGYVPESVTIIPHHALFDLDVPEIVLTEEVILADEPTEEAAEEEIEIHAMSLDDEVDEMEILDTASAPEVIAPIAEATQEVEAAAVQDDEMTLFEMPVDPRVFFELAHEDEPAAPQEPEPVAIAPVPAPPVAAKVTPDMLAEITATVGAQIAVEVTTEVAQLTRQHFSKLMDAFYKESLRKITAEIGHEMEIALMPRIEELVKDELRRQGMLD